MLGHQRFMASVSQHYNIASFVWWLFSSFCDFYFRHFWTDLWCSHHNRHVTHSIFFLREYFLLSNSCTTCIVITSVRGSSLSSQLPLPGLKVGHIVLCLWFCHVELSVSRFKWHEDCAIGCASHLSTAALHLLTRTIELRARNVISFTAVLSQARTMIFHRNKSILQKIALVWAFTWAQQNSSLASHDTCNLFLVW